MKKKMDLISIALTLMIVICICAEYVILDGWIANIKFSYPIILKSFGYEPEIKISDIEDWNMYSARLIRNKQPIEKYIWKLLNTDVKLRIKNDEIINESDKKIIIDNLNHFITTNKEYKDYQSENINLPDDIQVEKLSFEERKSLNRSLVMTYLNETRKPPKLSIWNYLVTVDLSTVTTALIATTLFFITVGFIRVTWVWVANESLSKDNLLTNERLNEKCRNLYAEYFPFWASYKDTYLYLGLLGTLFAFIIAFNQAHQISNYDPADMLLGSLGTALWSSFSAIILMMLPVPYLFRRLIVSKLIPVLQEDEANEIFDKLIEKTKIAEKAFEQLSNASNELSKKLEHNQILIALDSIRTLQGDFHNFQSDIREKISGVDKKFDILADEYRSTMNSTTEALNKKTDELNKNLLTQIERGESRINESIKTINNMSKKIAKFDEMLSILKTYVN